MHCLHFTKLFGSHDVANISTSPLRPQQQQQQQQQQQHQQQQQQQQQSNPSQEGGVVNDDEETIQLQSPLLQQTIDTAATTTAESTSLQARTPAGTAGTSSTARSAQLPTVNPNDHALPPLSPHRSTVAPSRMSRTASVHSVDTAGKGTPVC